MSDSCDPGIQASDVFTLQYFLLSIIILPIAYTKYKQYFMSGYKDVQAKQLYLKYLATFFSCSVIFSFFVGFVVKDVQKTILVSVNTLLMMTILFSGLSEKNMKPFTTTLSINLCFSIGCFIFYVVKIIIANPESTQSLVNGLTAAGEGPLSVLNSTGEVIKNTYQGETAQEFSKNISKLATAGINTFGDATTTVFDNVANPFKEKNLQKNYEKSGNAFASTGVATGIRATNKAVQNAKKDFIQNVKKANPNSQKNITNRKNFNDGLSNSGLVKMIYGKNKNQPNNQQVRTEIANSEE